MVRAGNRNALLEEQILYYQARAHEYDEWFFRQGRYDRGAELNKQWFTEIERVQQALDEFRPTGHVLEIACGTGLWTQRLVQHARQVTAIDAVSEVLAINQARTQSPKVHYLQADVFEWSPEVQHDAVFFGFWLSHVPPEWFGAFWNLVDRALKPNGRVFFVDSRYDVTSTAKDHLLEGSEATTIRRRLNDGREFRIVKVFYEATRLTEQLGELGWRFKVEETATYFIYGTGHKGVGAW
jgi:2-polyprenyl-3-methyl-5-hydroxy-6-metoxy-1,4-benzoquinol methylase